MDLSKNIKSTGPGWEHIVAPLIQFCAENGITINQIKEKFSSLRFYYTASDKNKKAEKALDSLIDCAEVVAERTCEWCGAPGRRRDYDDGFTWLKTLCDEHAEIWKQGKRW